MKTKISAIIPIVAALLTMSACNDIVDYNDDYIPASQKANDGTPQITAIYDIDDASAPITQGTLGQTIRIVGHNLNDARSIAFSGVEADLSQCYFASDSAFVVIPTRPNMQGDGMIALNWHGTDGNHSVTLPFRPTEHLLYPDLSMASISTDNLTCAIENDDALPATASKLNRSNIHVTGSYSAWSWNTIDLSANMIDAGLSGSLDDYVLKMEVLTSTGHPLTEGTPLQFCFNWGDSYTWTLGDGAGLNTAG